MKRNAENLLCDLINMLRINNKQNENNDAISFAKSLIQIDPSFTSISNKIIKQLQETKKKKNNQQLIVNSLGKHAKIFFIIIIKH